MILATIKGDVQYRGILEDILDSRRTGVLSVSGVAVNPRTVSGIPAMHAAVTFAAEAVACLPMKVWRGEGPIKERITTTWQARLFRGTPNPLQNWFIFWETVQGSLDYRGNAYIWKVKNDKAQVTELWALHPDQVNPLRYPGSKQIVYWVTHGDNWPTPPQVGKTMETDSSIILHIRGRGGTGEIIAPSPIALFLTSLGVALAKQQHEAYLFKNGAQGGLVVSFPPGITKEQADTWRECFDADHTGVKNSGRTKVVGGGAEVKQIGMTQKDAQFVESMDLSVLDIARITRVPAWFLGIQDKTEKPMSPEHEQQRWNQHGLSPRLSRIEAAINADPDLFGSSDIYAGFDTANLIRGDLATEADISLKKVQSGQWLVDEARAKDGLGELPDGLGKIPLIVPVGASPFGVPDPNAS